MLKCLSDYFTAEKLVAQIFLHFFVLFCFGVFLPNRPVHRVFRSGSERERQRASEGERERERNYERTVNYPMFYILLFRYYFNEMVLKLMIKHDWLTITYLLTVFNKIFKTFCLIITEIKCFN